jgi:conjugal transfer pilus assembly protein TraE
MNLGTFLQTWRGTTLENRIGRVAILVLALAVLVLSVLVGQVERTVVLVPPGLEKEVTLARDHASQEAKEAWGLHVAMLLGNVTPESVDVLAGALEALLHPKLAKEILERMRGQVEEIKRERVSMRFLPRLVAFDPATQTVMVSGQHRTEGPGAPPVSSERTYELRVEFTNYRPVITHLDAYSGGPKQPKPEEPPK